MTATGLRNVWRRGGHLWWVLVRQGLIAGLKALTGTLTGRQGRGTRKATPPGPEPTIKANHAALRRELQKVLDGPRGAFVVFTHLKTGKFVQFLGPSRRDDGLTLDLPLVALTGEEVQRARRSLRKLRLSLVPTSKAGEALAVKLGADARRAARVTLKILKAVHGLRSNDALTVELGSV